MKRIILLCLCLWSAMLVNGQIPMNMVFSYDDNGNRTGRVIVFSRADEGEENDIKEPELLPFASDSFKTVDVSIFPNPTNDKVFVELSGIENGQILKVVLMTATGKVLDEKSIASSEEFFDLSGKSSGIYLLELTLDQEKHVWKVIKK